MSKISQTFTTDDKDVIKSLQRMQAELLKTQQAYRKLSEETKKGGGGGSGGGGGAQSAAQKLIGGERALIRLTRHFAIAQLAISAVTRAYSEQEQRLDSLAQKSSDYQRKSAGLSVSGGARGKVSAISGYLRGLNATQEQGQAAFSAVGGTKGASFDRKKALTSAAVGAIGIGQDVDQFGGLISAFEEEKGGRSEEQLRDLATKAIAAGITPDEIRSKAKVKIGKRQMTVKQRLASQSVTYAEAAKNFANDPEGYEQTIEQQDAVRAERATEAQAAQARQNKRFHNLVDTRLDEEDAGLVRRGIAKSLQGAGEFGSTLASSVGIDSAKRQGAIGYRFAFGADDKSNKILQDQINKEEPLERALAELTAATKAATDQKKTAPVYDPKTTER